MSKAIRDVYGEALAKYGKDDKRVVVLDADVSSSTKSSTTSYTIVSLPLLSFLTPSGDVSVGVRLLHRDDRRLSRLHDHLQRRRNMII